MEKWQEVEVNQVNAKTLNRTNHSVLPVHLFTFSTDIILTHTHTLNDEQKGPWVEQTSYARTQVPEIITFIPHGPCLINWAKEEEEAVEKEKDQKLIVGWSNSLYSRVSDATSMAHTGRKKKKKSAHGQGFRGRL